jgi:hypothetical protein
MFSATFPTPSGPGTETVSGLPPSCLMRFETEDACALVSFRWSFLQALLVVVARGDLDVGLERGLQLPLLRIGLVEQLDELGVAVGMFGHGRGLPMRAQANCPATRVALAAGRNVLERRGS